MAKYIAKAWFRANREKRQEMDKNLSAGRFSSKDEKKLLIDQRDSLASMLMQLEKNLHLIHNRLEASNYIKEITEDLLKKRRRGLRILFSNDYKTRDGWGLREAIELHTAVELTIRNGAFQEEDLEVTSQKVKRLFARSCFIADDARQAYIEAGTDALLDELEAEGGEIATMNIVAPDTDESAEEAA